jgi:hypothetical protein
MSLNVNITKNYSPKVAKLAIIYFNFINLPQPSLLIEHHQNLVKYQFPNPIIIYHLQSNAPTLKYLLNIQHLLLDVVEKKNKKSDFIHVEVEHELCNGLEHSFSTRNLAIRPFS